MPTEKSTWKLGSEDVQSETHPSYGMLQISRIHGYTGSLFGSSVQNHNSIRLSIHPGKVDRHLNQDRYDADSTALVEIEMSPAQFAEAITTLNCGPGVPCTIRYLNGKTVEECPAIHKREQIKNEFDGEMRRLAERFKDGVSRVQELMKSGKPLSKAQREEVYWLVEKLHQDLNSNIPFIHDQFNEAMDKTVAEAKSEVDAFITHAVVSTGLAALAGEKPVRVPMLEDKP